MRSASLLVLAMASSTGCPMIMRHDPPPTAPAVRPLTDLDLTAAGVAFGADSATVATVLGVPTASSTSAEWRYPGLRLYFEDGLVRQIVLSSPAYEATRHLRVGADASQLQFTFGRSCVAGAYAFCRTIGAEPDERGILLEVVDGAVVTVTVGAVFDLE